jgi:hypothetical protein
MVGATGIETVTLIHFRDMVTEIVHCSIPPPVAPSRKALNSK